jgi:hypothetical protein
VSLLYCVSSVFYFHICFILLLCDPIFLTNENSKIYLPRFFGILEGEQVNSWIHTLNGNFNTPLDWTFANMVQHVGNYLKEVLLNGCKITNKYHGLPTPTKVIRFMYI